MGIGEGNSENDNNGMSDLLVIVRMMITGCWKIIISLASFKKIEIWFGLVLKRKTVQNFKKPG
jgi:hypothetical protein